MKTIKQTYKDSFREKGSKFIGYLFPAASINQFEKKLSDIESEYPDATHHCYAWRIDPNNTEEFSQDDGEPGGTAGPPILNKLKSWELINCGCIVVRYYGGTNLGKSGLIQAYGHSAELCIRKASPQLIIPTQNFEIIYPYSQQSLIDQLKNQFDLKEIDAQYLEKITLQIACRTEHADKFHTSLEKLEHKDIEVKKKEPGFVTMS